jgi:hypothetical protein
MPGDQSAHAFGLLRGGFALDTGLLEPVVLRQTRGIDTLSLSSSAVTTVPQRHGGENRTEGEEFYHEREEIHERGSKRWLMWSATSRPANETFPDNN